jgi:hypothetical protein
MVKVVDTPTLKRLCDKARRSRFNKLLDPKVQDKLDPGGKHVLSHEMLHNDGQCVRAMCVLLKLSGRDEPLEGMLDFDLEGWNDLPEAEESK